MRARDVCVREAILVNDFFRAYGETFSFQKQSYLISYCVYTAATIEIQQVDDPDEAVAAKATERLCTILRMLETEAKQTPGIRRSVDIIKSRLESREKSHRGQSHKALAGILSPEEDIVRTQPRALRNAGTTYTAAYGAPPVIQKQEVQSPEVVECHSNHLITRPVAAQTIDQGHMGNLMSGSMADAEMTEPGQWMEWGSFGFGGGFVPDTENLAFFDNFWSADDRAP